MKFFSVFFAALLSLSSVFFVSCSGNSETDINIDSTQVTQRDTVYGTWDLLRSDSIPENTMLMIVGFIGSPGDQITQSGSYITMPFFGRRNQRSGYCMNIQFRAGNLPNQMQELPDQFTKDDIKILCETGDTARIGSFVRITAFDEMVNGTRTWKVNLIEQGDFIFYKHAFEKAQQLTSKIIADSTINEMYCFVDGELEIPEIIFAYTNEITLDLKNSSVSEIISVEIPLGDGPSSMNDLPDNYTDADLILRDYEGQKIPYGSKVRLYGTWKRNSFDSTFPGKFYLEEIEVIKK